MGLIPEEILQAEREKYYAEHPTPAMVLVRTARENPTATVSELALIVKRSRSWVRKILAAKGITPGKARRKKVSAPDEVAVSRLIHSGRKRLID